MSSSNAIVKAEYRRAVVRWIGACALIVALMVVVGGYTRLSGSGLSITEWKPIHGVIPPLSAAEWEEEFAAYKQIPQFAQVNFDMTVETFKSIYWPEYYHRLLGRALGFVFLFPFVFFIAKKALTPRFALRTLGIFALGGAQGLVGWVMVQSGLTDQPYVSHVKLAAHLGLAFLIFALLLWALLDVMSPWGKKEQPSPSRKEVVVWPAVLLLLLYIQIIFGAFLAGLHGGLIYNTFPTMNSEWLPAGIWAERPWWMNPLENVTTIQFIHRWLGKALVILTIFWWCCSGRRVTTKPLKRIGNAALAVVLLQFALGVATLLHMVPLSLALLHQFVALVLFALFVALLHGSRTSPER